MQANVSNRSLIILAAWASLAAIAYATVTHVGFVYSLYFKLSPILLSPNMRTYGHLEHVIAFAVLGALFCIAYPRHIYFVCGVVVGSAAFLELLQTLTPDRHGTFVDAAEKIAGGLAGIIAARTILRFFQRGCADELPRGVE
jgi:hypothetical protein